MRQRKGAVRPRNCQIWFEWLRKWLEVPRRVEGICTVGRNALQLIFSANRAIEIYRNPETVSDEMEKALREYAGRLGILTGVRKSLLDSGSDDGSIAASLGARVLVHRQQEAF